MRILSSLVLAVSLACGPAKQDITCVNGWWAQSETGSCAIFCPGPPECSSTDCARKAVLGFLAPSGSVQASVTLSEATRQYSALVPPTRSKFTVSGDTLQIADDGPFSSFACSGDLLTFESSSFQRASAALTDSLKASNASDSWSARTY